MFTIMTTDVSSFLYTIIPIMDTTIITIIIITIIIMELTKTLANVARIRGQPVLS